MLVLQHLSLQHKFARVHSHRVWLPCAAAGALPLPEHKFALLGEGAAGEKWLCPRSRLYSTASQREQPWLYVYLYTLFCPPVLCISMYYTESNGSDGSQRL